MKICIDKAFKMYGDKRVLDIEHLGFEEGNVYCVLGLNGSGKSTLMECIAGINHLTGGSILYDGVDGMEHAKKSISIMLQKPYLFNSTGIGNIESGLRFRKLEDDEIRARIEKYTKYFDIEHLFNKNARKLSGGEGAKIAMLRTAVVKTELTIFDEPTASMDMESTIQAESLIRDMAGGKNTVIMVTHDLYQARRIADYVIFLDRGRVIEWGKKDRVLNNPESKLVRQILNIY
jgi:ABC-type multidrug transport system, ATPase component